jgi:hypothetical protein
MGITKLENQNLSNDAIGSGEIDTGAVDSSKIGAEIKNEDISPSANIPTSKLALPGPPSQFVRGDGTFGEIDTTSIDENAFNIGVLGFKMAVNEGLTLFNLVDGIVDEFNNESGVDTAENTNASYDSTSDFYTNDTTTPSPATTNIQAFWHNDGTFNDNQSADGGGASNNEVSPFTYTAPPTAKAVDLLVIGGGGAGGLGYTGSMVGSGGGGGAGGLVYIENFPVVGGGTYPITVGAGGGDEPDGGTSGADTTFTSPTPTPFGTSIVGEGGGAGGNYPNSPTPSYGYEGGSSGGHGWAGTNPIEEFTQATNHPIPGITPAGDNAVDQSPSLNLQGSYGGDGAQAILSGEYATGAGGGAGENATNGGSNTFSVGGAGLPYDIADGSTPIVYAGGGGGAGGYPMPSTYSPESPGGGGRGIAGTNSQAEPADATPQNPLLNGTSPPQFGPQIAALSFGGGGGGGGNNGGSGTIPAGGGNGGSGVVYVSVSQTGSITSTMTLVSDTFTASSTPSKARIVVFAELPDGTSDFAVSATRDNSTYNAITLTDEGYEAGSSGIKIFTGSTPLTGSASPQVQLRWKIVGSSLTGANKIHGVSLQWE